MKLYAAPPGTWLLLPSGLGALRVLEPTTHRGPGWCRRYMLGADGYLIDSGQDQHWADSEMEPIDVDMTDEVRVGASGPKCYPFRRRTATADVLTDTYDLTAANEPDPAFPFAEGDKLAWGQGYLEITAVGKHYFLALTKTPTQSIYEDRFSKTDDRGWERCVEPVVYPERWINVYAVADGYMATDGDFTSLLSADVDARRARPALHVHGPRVGILHLRPDGTTEMLAP